MAETDVGQAQTRYQARSLISVGRERSVHLAVRAGRFGGLIGSGATGCGVRGIARPAEPGAVPCGSCSNFESFSHPLGDGPMAAALAAAAAAAEPTSWVTKSDVTRYLRCP